LSIRESDGSINGSMDALTEASVVVEEGIGFGVIVAVFF